MKKQTNKKLSIGCNKTRAGDNETRSYGNKKKIQLHALNRRLERAEERIMYWKNTAQRYRNGKFERRVRRRHKRFRKSNIHVLKIQKGENTENGWEAMFKEIMVKNSLEHKT